MRAGRNSAAARRRTSVRAGDSMLLVIGVYGRVDWTIARLARARHPMLPTGDAYLRFMEEREGADLGALANTASRHEVKRRKMRDTLTGEIARHLDHPPPVGGLWVHSILTGGAPLTSWRVCRA